MDRVPPPLSLGLPTFGEGVQLDPAELSAPPKSPKSPKSPCVNIVWGDRSVNVRTPQFVEGEFSNFVIWASNALRLSRQLNREEIEQKFWDVQAPHCNLSLNLGEYAPTSVKGELRERHIELVTQLLDAKDRTLSDLMPTMQNMGTLNDLYRKITSQLVNYTKVPLSPDLRENTDENRMNLTLLGRTINSLRSQLIRQSPQIQDAESEQVSEAEDSGSEFEEAIHPEPKVLEGLTLMEICSRKIAEVIKQKTNEMQKLSDAYSAEAATRRSSSPKSGEFKNIKGEISFLEELNSCAQVYINIIGLHKEMVHHNRVFNKTLDLLLDQVESLAITPEEMNESEYNRRSTLGDHRRYTPSLLRFPSARDPDSREGAAAAAADFKPPKHVHFPDNETV